MKVSLMHSCQHHTLHNTHRKIQWNTGANQYSFTTVSECELYLTIQRTSPTIWYDVR